MEEEMEEREERKENIKEQEKQKLEPVYVKIKVLKNIRCFVAGEYYRFEPGREYKVLKKVYDVLKESNPDYVVLVK
jgi:hypothetical protein